MLEAPPPRGLYPRPVPLLISSFRVLGRCAGRPALRRAGTWLLALVGALTLAGCATTGTGEKDFEPVVARFYLEDPTGSGAAVAMRLPVSDTVVAVDPRVVISEADIARVELVRVDLGLCLLFVMSPEDARGLTVLTSANLGRRLVLTLNGRPVGARLIDTPITDGMLYTFVEIPDEELPALVANLQATTAEIQAAVAKSRRKR